MEPRLQNGNSHPRLRSQCKSWRWYADGALQQVETLTFTFRPPPSTQSLFPLPASPGSASEEGLNGPPLVPCHVPCHVSLPQGAAYAGFLGSRCCL